MSNVSELVVMCKEKKGYHIEAIMKLSLSTPPNEGETVLVVKIEGEDHTLGNSLRWIIMKNPDTEFCGYVVPHPSDHNIQMHIQTKSGVSAVSVLRKGLSDLQELAQHTRETFEEAMTEYTATDGMQE
ncbi:hypothetical protein SARC_07058 [Sphaeroforma arctica JP610]|uniref:DNA-directed RNA polymerase RBP11-like dimerisation domain-containing protein n=1 Tax=Sphaeroforma arctica JP610 TaxID=667725 RepID=A0A0L0FUU4_9EUKA|nr:hypothetical protein SARC_07058 [Sphaeroforma arctica JP610]KNC80587.1 hypothetical protein SARC_07058 [Sphaeroforma arctica JP610]|eukprot:XP_014154489.1 hypothetical protein SARC_07058 [Sphaeroforma arctica JP610]